MAGIALGFADTGHPDQHHRHGPRAGRGDRRLQRLWPVNLGLYPYSTRGRIVTMPGQSVSSSTKPTMMTR